MSLTKNWIFVRNWIFFSYKESQKHILLKFYFTLLFIFTILESNLIDSKLLSSIKLISLDQGCRIYKKIIKDFNNFSRFFQKRD